jgi:hypothetical protein
MNCMPQEYEVISVYSNYSDDVQLNRTNVRRVRHDLVELRIHSIDDDRSHRFDDYYRCSLDAYEQI